MAIQDKNDFEMNFKGNCPPQMLRPYANKNIAFVIVN